MALGDGVRRNITHVSPEERHRLLDAFIALDTTVLYPDGVTVWDKQEEIHKSAHAGGQDVHDGPGFLPWHRELVNRLEASVGVGPLDAVEVPPRHAVLGRHDVRLGA